MTMWLLISCVVVTACLKTVDAQATTHSPANITTNNCDDDPVSECWSRPDNNCLGIYEGWSRVHCPLRCGYCQGREPPCEDVVPHCSQFLNTTCIDPTYAVYVRQNCRKTCNMCYHPWNKTLQFTGQPVNNAVFYACTNSTLTLPWHLNLPAGDVIENIQWFFNGSQMIATEARDHFLPLPGYVGRAAKINNAGISLANVQTAESGNYSVELLVRTVGGNVVTFWRSAYVYVTDELRTAQGVLLASMLLQAEHNNKTGQFHIVLTCGNFSHPGFPGSEAYWMSPSGRNIPSSGYRDNRFYLLVPNPVEGGTYTCRVPTVEACGHTNNSAETSISLDQNDARLAVIEARQQDLESTNHMLNAQLTEMRQTRLRAVSFHARAYDTQHDLHVNAALQFPIVYTNVGDAYNGSSGQFSAPYNGSYFFSAHSQDESGNGYVAMSLVVDGVELDKAYTYPSLNYQTGVVQGIAYLTVGQKVWVRVPSGNNQFHGYYTAFSGFLII